MITNTLRIFTYIALFYQLSLGQALYMVSYEVLFVILLIEIPYLLSKKYKLYLNFIVHYSIALITILPNIGGTLYNWQIVYWWMDDVQHFILIGMYAFLIYTWLYILKNIYHITELDKPLVLYLTIFFIMNIIMVWHEFIELAFYFIFGASPILPGEPFYDPIVDQFLGTLGTLSFIFIHWLSKSYLSVSTNNR